MVLTLCQSFRINDRVIGPNHRPLVVAEAGVNHNGNLNVAKKLILQAKRVGADAIKFQTFSAEKLVSDSAESVKYQRASTGESYQLPMLRGLELSDRSHEELRDYCEEQEILFLSTPMSRHGIDLLHNLNIVAFKIASPDIVSLPMLEYIAKKKKPIILSTGMSNLDEVNEAVDILSQNTDKIVLMQCTSSYPCKLPFINLNVISTLQKLNVPVGFSDHSLGVGCAIASVLLGACIIEKHLTLSKKMNGPDHSMSLEPKEFELLVTGINMACDTGDKDKKSLVNLLNRFDPYVARNIDVALGAYEKYPTSPEFEMMFKTRKSVVPSKHIPKFTRFPDDVFSIWEDLFLFKRPNYGLPPKFLYQLPGKVAKRDLNRDEQIALSDFS
jgi:sialic acid synthase SpsE